MTKNRFMVASLDTEKVAALLRECARKYILPYHGALEDHHKSFKGGDPRNEVTIADQQSEEFLTRELAALLPGSEVVGEEACEDDPDIIDLLADRTKTVWVIDPIDGTSNFARGSKTFCVMVALVIEGETQAAWIYDVMSDSMAFAQKGKGAFVDGRKLDLNEVEFKGKPSGFTRSRDAQRSPDLNVRSLRCAGHEYLRIAKGEAAFSMYGRTKAWDHLAGALLVQEAGGYVARWDGSPYRPWDKNGIISAKDKCTWQKVRDCIPEKVLQKYGIMR